jgi:hypothetical protein
MVLHGFGWFWMVVWTTSGANGWMYAYLFLDSVIVYDSIQGMVAIQLLVKA